MRNSINRYQLLFIIFAATALLAFTANPAYAGSDSLSSEVSGGFCDCSTTGDLVCHIPPGNRANMHTI